MAGIFTYTDKTINGIEYRFTLEQYIHRASFWRSYIEYQLQYIDQLNDITTFRNAYDPFDDCLRDDSLIAYIAVGDPNDFNNIIMTMFVYFNTNWTGRDAAGHPIYLQSHLGIHKNAYHFLRQQNNINPHRNLSMPLHHFSCMAITRLFPQYERRWLVFMPLTHMANVFLQFIGQYNVTDYCADDLDGTTHNHLITIYTENVDERNVVAQLENTTEDGDYMDGCVLVHIAVYIPELLHKIPPF